MESYAAYVVKSFNIWADAILVDKQTVSFKVKPSKNWRKTLKKRLIADKNIDLAVPENYSQLVARITSTTLCKKEVICVVTEVDKKLTLLSFISTCLNLENFQLIPLLIVKVSGRLSNYQIQNVCKVRSSSKMWKPCPKINIQMTPNVKMQHYFCEKCAVKH